MKKQSNEQRECVALVRQARKQGHTLEQMAARLDVSFSSVSRWQNGISVPYRNTAKRMIPMLKRLLR